MKKKMLYRILTAIIFTFLAFDALAEMQSDNYRIPTRSYPVVGHP